MKNKFNLIRNWYNRNEVKFEIVKQLKNREFALLVSKVDNRVYKSTRNLRCHCAVHYNTILRATKMFEDSVFYQMYYSLAEFKTGMPFQTLNFTERKQDMLEWNNVAPNEIVSYLVMIDIDAKSHDDINKIFEQAKRVKIFLDERKKKYSLLFSGMGFHFVIHDLLSDNSVYHPAAKGSIYKVIKKWMEINIKPLAKNIDLSIYDPRRLAKLAYSLAIYEDSVYVCYPFSSTEEFLNFKLEEYEIMNFDKKIYKRGVYIFNQLFN